MPISLESITLGTQKEALTSDERCWIRDVLGISNLSSDSKMKETEDRFDEFSDYDNLSMRDLMVKYDALGESTFKSFEDDSDLDIGRDRSRIALAIYNKVFASESVTPLDNVNVSQYSESGASVSQISVNYADDLDEESEY